jgi:hypothetical protein
MPPWDFARDEINPVAYVITHKTIHNDANKPLCGAGFACFGHFCLSFLCHSEEDHIVEHEHWRKRQSY